MNKEEARRYVDRVLTDAHYDRERGGSESDADVLKAKLIEALTDPGASLRANGRG